MGTQGLDAVLVALGAVGCASAVAIFGNENGLAGKDGVKVIQMLSQCFKSSRIPSSKIFIYLDDVHQSGCVSFRSFDQGVRSIGTKSIVIQPLRLRQHMFCKLMRGRMLPANFFF